MRTTALLVITLFCTGVASAQQAPESCTYEQCALHVQRSLLGYQVLRGNRGAEVGSGGVQTIFNPKASQFELSNAVASSPEALIYARRYERQKKTALVVSTAAGVGALVTLGSMALGARYERVGRAGMWSWLGLTAVSIPLNLRARASFDRSIATYNAALSESH